MNDERSFLSALNGEEDDLIRQAYADWLEERGDDRAEFVRLHRVLRVVPPDHPLRPAGEELLSKCRKGRDANWLYVVEPERRRTMEPAEPPGMRMCECMALPGDEVKPEATLHVEPQDTECDAWKRLVDDVAGAAAERLTVFHLLRARPGSEARKIVTLPAAFKELTSLQIVYLYYTRLIRLPAELGAFPDLVGVELLASHRLHWFPYEILRGPWLRRCNVAFPYLYGGPFHKPSFPEIVPYLPGTTTHAAIAALAVHLRIPIPTRPCSVCSAAFEDDGRFRMWTMHRLGDVDLPVLVNACSRECVNRVPDAPRPHPPRPHHGGKGVPSQG